MTKQATHAYTTDEYETDQGFTLTNPIFAVSSIRTQVSSSTKYVIDKQTLKPSGSHETTIAAYTVHIYANEKAFKDGKPGVPFNDVSNGVNNVGMWQFNLADYAGFDLMAACYSHFSDAVWSGGELANSELVVEID